MAFGLVAVCIFLLPTKAQATTEYEGDYAYTVERNQATIVGYSGTSENVVIPTTLGGYRITEIGGHAFLYSNVKSVVIPSGVNTIYPNVFPSSLTEITLPKSIAKIYGQAFWKCENLKTVYFAGSEPDWDFRKLGIDTSQNEALINADIIFDYNGCNHIWGVGTVTKEPTCSTGLRSYTCRLCEHIRTESIPAVGHSWDDGEITLAATCQQSGRRRFTCAYCGTHRDENIPRLDRHVYDEGTITREPTCKNTGMKWYGCIYCNASCIEEIPVLQTHTYDNGKVTKEPTCTETGTKAFTCIHCGDSYTEELPLSQWHTYNDGEVTKEPTCTEAGTKAFTCIHCGDSYTESFGEPLSHSYAEGVCTVCGESDPNHILQGDPIDNSGGGFFAAIAAFFESIFRILFWFLYL